MSKVKQLHSTKKTKEEIQNERFWNSCPTRQEVTIYVDNALHQHLSQILSAINLSMKGLQEILIEKGICVDEDFSRKMKEIEEKLFTASKEQAEEQAEKLKPNAVMTEDLVEKIPETKE